MQQLLSVNRYIPKICLVLFVLFFYLSIKTLTIQPQGRLEVAPNDQNTQIAPVTIRDEKLKLDSMSKKINKPVYSHPIDIEDDKCIKKYLGTPESILKSRFKEEFKHVTCAKLLFGNISDAVYGDAKNLMSKQKKKPFSPTYLQDNIQDIGCIQFKLTRGYHISVGSLEEKEYPIAYNLLIHQDLDQVEKLLRAIYRPQNSYCIHIDAKVKPELVDSVRALASCFDNVYLASRLERIVYAGFSRLQADINCMKDQVNQPIKWKYLINTAGQGFPAKTNAEMVKILKIYNGANDIEGIYGPRVHRGRFVSEWKELGADTANPKMNKTGRTNPNPPHNIDIVRGSAYGIFSRQFIEWLLTDDKAKALLEWSRHTWSPDEHYWATLHHRYSNPHLHPPGGYAG